MYVLKKVLKIKKNADSFDIGLPQMCKNTKRSHELSSFQFDIGFAERHRDWVPLCHQQQVDPALKAFGVLPNPMLANVAP